MSGTDAEIRDARVQADVARERLTSSLHKLQEHLKPGAIAHRTTEKVKATGTDLARTSVDTAKRRPLAAAGIGAGLALVALRRPILHLFGRGKNSNEGKTNDGHA